jgi:cystathionine gamma-synthase
MIGAVGIPMNREHCQSLESVLAHNVTVAYASDLARLGASLENAISVLNTINANTMVMADFFEPHPGVLRLHWTYGGASGSYYEAIQRRNDSPGGVLTLELVKPIEQVYDRLLLPKGPSFGTEFTLVCPYIHLAHYDLLQDDSGRKRMEAAGIHANMIRVSIGTEHVDDLKAAFDHCL